MGQKGLLIHKKRTSVGKEAPQLIEDGKAVGVDVSPIVEFLLMEPIGAGKVAKTVTGPEKNHPFGDIREGQEVDLVFGDEDRRKGRIKGGEGTFRQGDIVVSLCSQKTDGGVKHAKTDP